MKQIDNSYKLIEFLSGKRSSAEPVVNVTTVEFGFGAVVLIEKLVSLRPGNRKKFEVRVDCL